MGSKGYKWKSCYKRATPMHLNHREIDCCVPTSPTRFAGFPATIVFGSTGFNTREPAAIWAPSPTMMLPNTFAEAPIKTLLPIFGCLSPSSFPVPPRVIFYKNIDEIMAQYAKCIAQTIIVSG